MTPRSQPPLLWIVVSRQSSLKSIRDLLVHAQAAR